MHTRPPPTTVPGADPTGAPDGPRAPDNDFDVFRHQDWRAAVADWRSRAAERTLRWLAEKAGCAYGHLSNVISPGGKELPPSPDLVRTLTTLLELDPDGRSYFEALVTADTQRRAASSAPDRTAEEGCLERMDAALALAGRLKMLHDARRRPPPGREIVGRWEAMVLHEALRTEGWPRDPGGMAARLRPPVSPEALRQALDHLARSGLLDPRSGRPSAGATPHWYRSESGVPAESLRDAHVAALRHVTTLMDPELLPRDLRTYKVEVVAMPASLLPELRRRMEELLAWVHQEAAEAEHRDAVYVIAMQAVPAVVPPGR